MVPATEPRYSFILSKCSYTPVAAEKELKDVRVVISLGRCRRRHVGESNMINEGLTGGREGCFILRCIVLFCFVLLSDTED